MLTKEDLKKIQEVIATKEDIKDLKIGFVSLREDIKEIKENLAGFQESVQFLTIAVDKLTKAIEGLSGEYIAMGAKVDRHGKWIHQIAEKVGLQLEV